MEPNNPAVKEKRRYPRLNINVNVEYSVLETSESVAGNTKNISAGGICLIVYEDIKPGTILKLQIYLPDNHNPIQATGKVVWRSKVEVVADKRVRFDTGIEFLDIKDSDRNIIAQHIFSLLPYST